MHRRHNGSVGSSGLVAPLIAAEILTDHLWRSRDGCNQLSIGPGKEHPVNIRMGIEGGVKPLLAGGRRVGRGETFRNFRQRLVMTTNAAATAEIGSDHMRSELD